MNYLKRSFVLLLILCTLFSFGQTTQNYESWESQLDTGLEFLDGNNYKEALVFALLGLLKEEGKVNCLKSVTGARKNHSSGMIFE